MTAHIGYNARAITRLIEWAATGVETPMYASREIREHEINFGANLPAEAWHHKVKTAQGRIVPAEETVWMRTREVWTHAVDLDNGATFSDIPAPVLERLLKDITGAWKTRGTDTGLLIKVEDSGTDEQPGLEFGSEGPDAPLVITGTLAGVTRWATGRGTDGVTATQDGAPLDTVPAAPKWI
ncbi:MAG: mycothiol-dependent maleylpyruvate isomerase NagL [Pseudarthrobacter sp.]